MDSFWGELRDFEQENKPEDILKSQFELLQKQTEGTVIGGVERFDKTVEEQSLTTSFAFETRQIMMIPQAQNYLGETKDVSGLTFEVYLTAPKSRITNTDL